jgi:hypothetical protein
MTRPRPCLIALALVTLVAGCVRAGFGAAGDETDGARHDGTRPAEVGGQNGLHDICATALVIDGNQAPLQVPVDTSGAVNDYEQGCCGSRPEIVLRLVNMEGTGVKPGCSGGGTMGLHYGVACPPTGFLCFDIPCDGSDSGSFSGGPVFLIICRDPAQGPAVLSLAVE